jgi:hypothetical protein
MSTTSLDFYTTLVKTGDNVLTALTGAPQAGPSRHYLDVLARICEILAQIHEQIIDAMVNIGGTDDLDDARGQLAQINQQGLRQSFKAQELCDELGQLGRELLPVLESDLGVSRDDVYAWEVLSQHLEGREEEVAQLYDESLYELRILAQTAQTVDDVQNKVGQIAGTLAIQKAQFDLLSKKAKVAGDRLETRTR